MLAIPPLRSLLSAPEFASSGSVFVWQGFEAIPVDFSILKIKLRYNLPLILELG